jgi:hypothetical protein
VIRPVSNQRKLPILYFMPSFLSSLLKKQAAK